MTRTSHCFSRYIIRKKREGRSLQQGGVLRHVDHPAELADAKVAVLVCHQHSSRHACNQDICHFQTRAAEHTEPIQRRLLRIEVELVWLEVGGTLLLDGGLNLAETCTVVVVEERGAGGGVHI